MLYRGMKAAPDGLPQLGADKRTLGAKPDDDIPVAPDDGKVTPGTDGMSVAPDDPLNLPKHRRPPELGGTGPDPVFQIDERSLSPNLRYRGDPLRVSVHGFVEPARDMTFEDYQNYLWATRSAWSRVSP